AHRRDALEAGPRGQLLGTELLAAPRADDEVGLALDDVGGGDDAVARRLAAGALGEDIAAARHGDQLRHPGDAGDVRLVPFLEIGLGPPRQARRPRPGVVEPGGELVRETVGALAGADEGAERTDHGENLGDAALVEGVDRDARADQRRDDVGLKIREAQHQVRAEIEDLGNIRRGEGRDARLVAARLGRAHAIAGDADDAPLLAEEVERLDGLLGQADDALGRKHRAGPSLATGHPGATIRGNLPWPARLYNRGLGKEEP